MRVPNELKAGVFILVGLCLFLASILIMGKERHIFARMATYHAVFSDIKGLSVGAPVRLGGITIGRVDKVGFSQDLSDPKIHVTLLINEEFLERVRVDSVVAIETQGLLGDRFLSVSAGKDLKQMLPGTILKSDESGDFSQILAKAGTAANNVAEISESVNQFLASFKTESQGDLQKAFKSLSEILNEVETGNGFLHRLVYSPEEGKKILDGLSKISANLGSMMEEAKNGKGVLHALIYDPIGQETVKALSDAAGKISKITEQIQSGQGMLHEIFYKKPEKGLSDVLTELSSTASNLRLASEALARGSGTIGALLVDSKLYDNLVEVTDGAKRSFILRQAIRSSISKSDTSNKQVAD